MNAIFWVRSASACLFLAVAIGAFGAHGLKNILADDMKVIFETGVRYQTYHALGLFAVAWLAERFPSKPVNTAGACFLAGIVIFSGSLYALSLTGIRKWGAVTPIGGLLFLIGWGLLLSAPYKS